MEWNRDLFQDQRGGTPPSPLIAQQRSPPRYPPGQPGEINHATRNGREIRQPIVAREVNRDKVQRDVEEVHVHRGRRDVEQVHVCRAPHRRRDQILE